MTSYPLSLDGYTDIPNDKVAYVVTYLEMTQAPEEGATARGDVTLERWTSVDPAEYKALYREIGETWLWFSRLRMSEDKLVEILRRPGTELYVPMRDGKRLGMLEIDVSNPHSVEIVFFGLVPDAVGGGLGRWLMQSGLDMVWARPDTGRVWLHTCTGDSPAAIHFYQACGFKPYKRAIEVADDPRATGLMPAHLGRHVPYLG